MYLIVELDAFADAVKRHDSGSNRMAYWQRSRLPGAGELVHLSYGIPGTSTIILAETIIGDEDDFSDIMHKLKSAGIESARGTWTDSIGPAIAPGSDAPTGRFWVGAVAYKSDEDAPGIWMDAFTGEPSDDAVLRSMFDEFLKSGDLAGVNYDDFIHDSAPTVQVVASSEVQGWLRNKG